MSIPSLMRFFLAGFIFVLSPFELQGQESMPGKTGSQHGEHIMVVSSELTWKEGPASLPPGVRSAVLEGDPAKPGPFTMRLKLPAFYEIPPHWHPAIEHVTVISGVFYMGLGEVYEESKATKLPAGGFAVMAVGTRHFAFTKEEGTIIQLHGIGPWGITYVNPEEDPRNDTVQ